ncbi:uncharacterized protein LOC133928069 [Phragmites australis]|uniref:uncharacterized protein LOC133928069 n=1 Tax=Phragmites australis TaxID=29695 RepID=UPI002D772977|nr:uncharacterized protein LOC133928069 [Phragmites australis]
MGSGADHDQFKKLLAEQQELLRTEFQTNFSNIQSTLTDVTTALTGVMNRLTRLEQAKSVAVSGNADESANDSQLDGIDPPAVTDDATRTMAASSVRKTPGDRAILGGPGILQNPGLASRGTNFLPAHPPGDRRQYSRRDQEDVTEGVSGGIPKFFKLDFPTYDGKDDPLPWLNRCEMFFRVQQTEERHKVWLASFNMDGDTHHWYAHLERVRGEPPWPVFRQLCNARFGPPIRSNPLGELRLLRQTGFVNDYQCRFLALLSRADPLTETQERQLFTSGLADEIRIDVELQDPMDLEHAMSLARAYEKKATRYGRGANTRIPPRSIPLSASGATPIPSTGDGAHLQRPIKRLTPSEMAERRRLGLCFNCDDKFTRGHRCAHLFYVELDDTTMDDGINEDHEEPADEPHISLYAVAGVQSAGTVRLRVTLAGQALLALVDSGSSHNFIRDKVAVCLGLHLHTVRTGLCVTVANGDQLRATGVCRSLSIGVGQEVFKLDCFAVAE